MAGFPWEVLYPNLVGVRLPGSLDGWASPKDVILRVLAELTVKGGTNRVVQYFGPGASSISCTGKGTITNMGAELGATTSIFEFDERMATYLQATEREGICDVARAHMDLLSNDPEVEADPGKYFDVLVEIDLSTLEPHIVGPHTPDLARTISQLPAEVRCEGLPGEALVGADRGAAPTPRTRTCRARPRWRDRPPRAARRRRRRSGARRARSRSTARSSATARWPTSRRSVPPCSRTPAVRASASGSGTTSSRASHELDPQLVQPELPDAANGRQRGDAGSFIGSPEIVDRLRAGRSPRPSTRMTDEVEAADGSRIQARSRPAPAPDDAGAGLRDRSSEGYVEPPAGADVGRGRRWRSPPPASGSRCWTPFAPWDGRRLRGDAAPAEGPRQVHHGPHLAGGAVASLPRASGQHQRQHRSSGGR